jgi:hypothetical protein
MMRLELDRKARFLYDIEQLTADCIMTVRVARPRKSRQLDLKTIFVADTRLPRRLVRRVAAGDGLSSQVPHRWALTTEVCRDHLRHLLIRELDAVGGPGRDPLMGEAIDRHPRDASGVVTG